MDNYCSCGSESGADVNNLQNWSPEACDVQDRNRRLADSNLHIKCCRADARQNSFIATEPVWREATTDELCALGVNIDCPRGTWSTSAERGRGGEGRRWGRAQVVPQQTLQSDCAARTCADISVVGAYRQLYLSAGRPPRRRAYQPWKLCEYWPPASPAGDRCLDPGRAGRRPVGLLTDAINLSRGVGALTKARLIGHRQRASDWMKRERQRWGRRRVIVEMRRRRGAARQGGWRRGNLSADDGRGSPPSSAPGGASTVDRPLRLCYCCCRRAGGAGGRAFGRLRWDDFWADGRRDADTARRCVKTTDAVSSTGDASDKAAVPDLTLAV